MPALHGEQLRGLSLPAQNRSAEGRFGFMFKGLPAFEPPDDLLDGLATTMVESRDTPPAQSDHPRTPAGFTFLGQFIDHDLTFDTTPLEAQRLDKDAATNFRSARFDLDSVYGLGPGDDSELYDPDDGVKLLIDGTDDPGRPDDLPRQANGRAFIGDPRNDENLIVCQIHLAFLKFHNRLVDHVRSQGVPHGQVFEEARRLARWHYQWIVVHDFLPRVVGQGMVDQILEERGNQPPRVRTRHYKPGNPNKPMMPLEFSVAAYRFGHSMIRPGYRVNATAGGVFFGDLPSNQNLNGFRPIPPNLVVEWQNFIDIPGQPPPQRARRIDTRLSGPLMKLPASVVPPPDPRVSLPQRNLIRGKRLRLPSGQAVATEMGVNPLSNQQLGLSNDPRWNGEAPLWYYVVKEAEIQHNGEQLGEVGGRIVAEVLLGLLERDSNSYLRARPTWRPEPPIGASSGQVAIGDMLKFAGAL